MVEMDTAEEEVAVTMEALMDQKAMALMEEVELLRSHHADEHC